MINKVRGNAGLNPMINMNKYVSHPLGLIKEGSVRDQSVLGYLIEQLEHGTII
jgi:hypothetical protein